uniref:Uncharacterized protein n=1 Tax=Arundo donax TaxID=35708 RepID=A0A0A9DQG8_ARUDO
MSFLTSATLLAGSTSISKLEHLRVLTETFMAARRSPEPSSSKVRRGVGEWGRKRWEDHPGIFG